MQLITSARLGSSTWLLHLRSFAIVGQLLTILAARLLINADLRYASLLCLVGLTAVTNLGYAAWLHRARKSGTDATKQASRDRPGSIESASDETPTAHAIAAALMILDLITLTGMLYLSGGADNPFSFFYFVNLAVGGVMIRPAIAWSMAILASLGYTLLLHSSVQVAGISVAKTVNVFDLRTGSLMFAFATCSSVVTYFVLRTAGELKQREKQLLLTQAAQAASERLEGLTTLAAGAAHELATPLSTIDVIARELSRHLEGVEKPESVDTDLKLIDGQLDMCRQILSRMRGAAGDSMAQRWDRTTVGDLIDAVLEGIRDPHLVDVIDGSDDVEQQLLWVPQEAVAQAVRNLIHNGLDAGGPLGRVNVEPKLDGQSLLIEVADNGTGMTTEVLGRASDPFFTTKEPGRGIGLGLFLTHNVISKLGGHIDFFSTPGKGTRVVVRLPLGEPHVADA